MDLGKVWRGFWEGFGRGLGRILDVLEGFWEVWGHFGLSWGSLLGFACVFEHFMHFYVFFDWSSQAKPCFIFSSLRLHVSITLIPFRSSRSRAKTGFPNGFALAFFSGFFRVFFQYRFFIDFSSILDGFGGQNCSQNRFLDSFLGCFFGTLILDNFLMRFYVFVNAKFLENNDFTYGKCMFLRFCVFSTCSVRGSKMHAKIDGF